MDRSTAKLVNRLTAMLVNCLTATLVNRLTAKLVVVNLVKLHLTKLNSFSYYAAKHWIALPDNLRALAGTKEIASRVHGVKL